MKLKRDFVTNSSSASFILSLKCKGDEEDVKDELDRILRRFYSTCEWNGWKPREINLDELEIKKIVGKPIYQIEEFTSMFNDVFDIPDYIRYILLLDATGEMNEYCISVHDFDVDRG